MEYLFLLEVKKFWYSGKDDVFCGMAWHAVLVH